MSPSPERHRGALEPSWLGLTAGEQQEARMSNWRHGDGRTEQEKSRRKVAAAEVTGDGWNRAVLWRRQKRIEEDERREE
jgi:hypothetical protein